MIHRFPYAWAGELDTETFAPCRVYGFPRAPAAPDRANLAAALRTPIGTPPLADMLRAASARTVLVLADDLTRPTPQAAMLPPLLDLLAESGIEERNVTVLVATGLHRAMGEEEITRRFGPRVAGRVRIVNHDAYDVASLVPLGVSADGTPVLVNRLVKEHDFVVSVGCIEPHRVAGFSGGAKMVQPGICGERITAAIHWRAWLMEGEEIYGRADNPIRREMEDIGDRAGLRFIVNAVLDAEGGPRSWFCGDPRLAFRAGCAESGRLCSVEVKRADIVIADAHPFDIDLWQACKAVSVAELVVRPGGTVVLVASCPEGLSRHAARIRATGYLRASDVVRRVADGTMKDLAVACHLMALGRTLERGDLLVVSPGLDPALWAEVGLRCAVGPGEAIRQAREKLGRDATVAILGNACAMIPLVRGEAGGLG